MRIQLVHAARRHRFLRVGDHDRRQAGAMRKQRVDDERTDDHRDATAHHRQRPASSRIGPRREQQDPRQRQHRRVHQRHTEVREHGHPLAFEQRHREKAGAGQRHDHQHREQPQAEADPQQHGHRPAASEGDCAEPREQGQRDQDAEVERIPLGVEAEDLQRRFEHVQGDEEQQPFEQSLGHRAHLQGGADQQGDQTGRQRGAEPAGERVRAW